MPLAGRGLRSVLPGRKHRPGAVRCDKWLPPCRTNQVGLLRLHAGKAAARQSRVLKACGIKHGESERLLDTGLQDRDKCGGGKLPGSQIKAKYSG